MFCRRLPTQVKLHRIYSSNIDLRQKPNVAFLLKISTIFLVNYKKTPIIKDETLDASGETFIQFDMFDQKPNFIKTTAETDEVFSTFKVAASSSFF